MQLVKISSLRVEERQRSSYNETKYRDLYNSIKDPRIGLINPITVEGDLLIAGETRLKVVSQLFEENSPIYFEGTPLPNGLIPCVQLSELSEESRILIELDENLRRDNLSFIDEARALQKLHELRKRENPNQTATATAKELADRQNKDFTSHTLTRTKSLLDIAPFLDDPDVAKAGGIKEAEKIVRKKVLAALESASASLFSGGISNNNIRLENKPMEEFIASLPDGCIDTILTDPPYGINMDKQGIQSNQEHLYDDSSEYLFKLMQTFIPEAFRVCKDLADVYMFFDLHHWDKLKQMFELNDFWVYPKPLVWDKGSAGITLHPRMGHRHCYETIIYATKGGKAVRKILPDVLNYPTLRDKVHAAEKPYEILKDLLERSCDAGDTVADFFAGSGSLIPVCKDLGLKAVCCELDTGYYNTALTRLQDN